MDDQAITLIQDSFAEVVPIADAAAQIFYDNLFETAPQVKPYFAQSDMTEQGKKLMATLGTVVAGLRNLDAIVPVAEDLARRHVGYGVKAEDYDAVGASLLYTLGAGLGDAFTPAVKAAWTDAYVTLSGVMRAAAYPEPAAQA